MELDSARLNVSPCSSAKLGLHNSRPWSQDNLPRLISPTDVRHMARLTSLTPLDCLLVPETLSCGVVPGGGLRVAPPLPVLSVRGQERWWNRARPPERPRLCGSTGSGEVLYGQNPPGLELVPGDGEPSQGTTRGTWSRELFSNREAPV